MIDSSKQEVTISPPVSNLDGQAVNFLSNMRSFSIDKNAVNLHFSYMYVRREVPPVWEKKSGCNSG